jgi:hypothetical protein
MLFVEDTSVVRPLDQAIIDWLEMHIHRIFIYFHLSVAKVSEVIHPDITEIFACRKNKSQQKSSFPSFELSEIIEFCEK